MTTGSWASRSTRIERFGQSLAMPRGVGRGQSYVLLWAATFGEARPEGEGGVAASLGERESIRRMDGDGVPRARIARGLNPSRNTVSKFADRQGTSPKPPIGQERARRATDEMARWVDAMPTDGLCAPRKRRCAASRVLGRAVEGKGCAGSYPSTRGHVATCVLLH